MEEFVRTSILFKQHEVSGVFHCLCVCVRYSLQFFEKGRFSWTESARYFISVVSNRNTMYPKATTMKVLDLASLFLVLRRWLRLVVSIPIAFEAIAGLGVQVIIFQVVV